MCTLVATGTTRLALRILGDMRRFSVSPKLAEDDDRTRNWGGMESGDIRLPLPTRG